ncbi:MULTISPECIES: CPBP family intramembrane glutamic endopeptidase [unclassified Caulobacter]|uniref:CPBP family intramembrane glutamic endopeptidase n=1 Tax=unclassified Caulobacter TaxID=2648921 RepID=UPI0012E3C247|nr:MULTISPECIES: CPBP family intramembrane glutamic endopeptidase [unclassified Caulobacter]
MAGVVTSPIERRIFGRALSTRHKLLAYGGTMVMLWAPTLAAISIRGWPALAVPASPATWLPARQITEPAIGALVAGYFVLGLWPLLQSLRGERWRGAYAAAIRKQGAAFPGILPNTGLECAVFAVLSLTAGFCEEILFRGFMIRFLVQGPPQFGMLAALVLSSAVFGLNHAYQGAKGVVGTAISGLGFGLVFALSGALLPSILLHALVNLQVAYVLRPSKTLKAAVVSKTLG